MNLLYSLQDENQSPQLQIVHFFCFVLCAYLCTLTDRSQLTKTNRKQQQQKDVWMTFDYFAVAIESRLQFIWLSDKNEDSYLSVFCYKRLKCLQINVRTHASIFFSFSFHYIVVTQNSTVNLCNIFFSTYYYRQTFDFFCKPFCIVQLKN